MLDRMFLYAADSGADAGNSETEKSEPASGQTSEQTAQDALSSFESWLDAQPESAKAQYAQHLAGLRSALEKERAARREHERQLKRLAELEAEEAKRRDAEKSEIERLQERLQHAEQEAREARLSLLRRQAAEKYKLPEALANRLRGETLEEIEQDAEEIAKTLPKPILSPTNPSASAASQGETDEQRRARIYGAGRNIFDPHEAQRYGGGVVYPSKED